MAFCTSNVVPGIDFSDDPLLQGRNFSYNDTQTSRLGSQNYNNSIPINRPVCPVMNFQRDNAFRTSITKGPNYYPNRFDALNGLAEPSYPALAHDQSVDGVPGQTAGMSKHIQQSVIGKGGFVHFPERIEGLKVKMNGQKFSNYYEQAQLFYNSMTPVEQEHIKAAAAFELGKCDDPIIWKRMVARYNHVNHEFAVWIAKELGVDPPSAPETYTSEKSAALSMIANNPRTIATRRIAIITLPGFDQAELTAIRSPLAAKGAMTFIIGARRGPVDGLATDFSLETCRSTMFDAVFLPLSSPAAGKVAAENGRVKHFIREQAGHQKPIAASGAPGAALVRSVLGDDIPEIAIATAGAQVVESHGIVTAADVSADPSKFVAAFENALREHRAWDRPGVARLAF